MPGACDRAPLSGQRLLARTVAPTGCGLVDDIKHAAGGVHGCLLPVEKIDEATKARISRNV